MTAEFNGRNAFPLAFYMAEYIGLIIIHFFFLLNTVYPTNTNAPTVNSRPAISMRLLDALAPINSDNQVTNIRSNIIQLTTTSIAPHHVLYHFLLVIHTIKLYFYISLLTTKCYCSTGSM